DRTTSAAGEAGCVVEDAIVGKQRVLNRHPRKGVSHDDGTAGGVDVVLCDGLTVGELALPDGHDHSWIIDVAAPCRDAATAAVAAPPFETHSGNANAFHGVGEIHDGRGAAVMRDDAWI